MKSHLKHQEEKRREWEIEIENHARKLEEQRRQEEECKERVRQEWQREMESHFKHQEEERLE